MTATRPQPVKRLLQGLMAALCVVAAASTDARAQPSGAFQGLQQNRNDPIKIESLSLEVRDKEKKAIFIDNVKVVQGDTTLECKRLIVFYDEEPQPGAAKGKKAKPAIPASTAPGQQQIRRLEAKGGVVVTQKDQVATGDDAVYDMKTNTITINGNVVVTQGQNVLRGDRLLVDMTTNVSRVESGAAGQTGRVQGLFLPGSVKDRPGAPTPQANPATTGSAAPPAATSSVPEKRQPSQNRPLRLN